MFHENTSFPTNTWPAIPSDLAVEANLDAGFQLGKHAWCHENRSRKQLSLVIERNG